MKKKLVIESIIIVSIFLLAGFTSATELNVVNENSQTKLDTNNSLYIDPNIRLAKPMLTRLKLAVEKIDNPIDKKLVDRIIQTLENKGVVCSKDIKNILNDINSDYKNVYWFSIIEGNSAGMSWCSSFPMLLSLFILHGAFWIGPALFLSWDAESYPPNHNIVDIKGNRISQDHKGFALLPIGFWSAGVGVDQSGHPGTGFGIYAFSPLVFVS